jgi:hypothetical protein
MKYEFGKKSKGKVCPKIDHEGAEGEWRYSDTLYLTSAVDGVEWLIPRNGRFTPRERNPVHVV